jgi:hypothetical protein
VARPRSLLALFPRLRWARAAAGLVALLAALARAGPARAQFDAIETRDLRLIYLSPAHSFIAPYTARCFENSMRFHRALFGYRSGEKVNVMLDDFTDYSNAGVWVSPRSSMVVHLAPVNFVYETGPSNERMSFTMNHECVHVVALDQAAGSDLLFRDLFLGKVRELPEHPETMLYSYLTVPRRAAPRWYHEGLAVFLETWLAGGYGRAQGPYDEMVFRSMVRDSSHFYDPLGLESEGTKVDFQVGVNSYLYGTRFMTWLAYDRGPERLMEWTARRDGTRKYFASQFKKVYGQSLNDAWSDWIRFEKSFQAANLDSIRKYPTTPSHDLSTRALGSVSRAFVDSAGRQLIAAAQYPGRVGHLAAIPLEGGAPRHLVDVKGPALYFVTSLAFDPRARSLFYTADNNEWRDLFTYDLATGRSRRLIRDARIGDLAFNRADRSLWGVRHLNGISTLVRMTPPYRTWNQVYSPTYGRDFYDLDLSPDGKWLSASLAEVTGRQTLRLMRTDALLAHDTSSRVLYDFGSSIPTSFVFSDDGRFLYGSSYFTGVSNIFRYDLQADSMDVVTNAETGFFRPIPLGRDSLIAFRYSGEGFVPCRLEGRPLHDVSATRFLGAEIVEKHPVLKTWLAPPPSRIPLDSLVTHRGPYGGFRLVRVTSAYPIVEAYKAYTSVGMQANFSDPMSIHDGDVTLSYSPGDEVPSDQRLHLKARYRRLGITATAQYDPASFYDLFGPRKESHKGTGASLGYHRALIYDKPSFLDLDAELSGWKGLERLPDEQNVATAAGFDRVGTGELRLRYRNLRQSIGAADVEKGWSGGLTATYNDVKYLRAGGATWKGSPKFSGTLDEGSPIFIRNSSVWLRTAAGWSPGDRDEPFANFHFGGFGNNYVDREDPKRYREAESFPGLDFDAVNGTNFGKATLDWNLPALRFRRAGTLALYASFARLSLFGMGLVTNVDDDPTRRRLANAGAQVDVRFQLLTTQPLTLSAGYARAFERHRIAEDQWMVSLKIL